MDSHIGPSQEWIQKSVAEVTAKYLPDKRCTKLAWAGGPQCEAYGVHIQCYAATPFEQPDMLFDGPIPSNTQEGVYYHVKIFRVGSRGECSCPGFRYRHKDCSHIIRLREVLSR